MSYIRTEEIKQKQRETMLRVTKTVDHVAAMEKRKATLAANGTKLGRPWASSVSEGRQAGFVRFVRSNSGVHRLVWQKLA